MKRTTISYTFSCVVVGAALLLAAYTGAPWAAIAPGVLFVFVAFPRWRGKLYRLVETALGAVTRTFKNDRCDRE